MLHGEGTQEVLNLIFFILGFVAGMTIPLRYGMERLNGFARWVVSKLPYKAPPGKTADEALEQATDEND